MITILPRHPHQTFQKKKQNPIFPSKQAKISHQTNQNFIKVMTLKPSKMSAETPIKIGTKGTVGSLMMKEIEYFNKLEVHSHKHRLQVPAADTPNGIGSQPKVKVDSVVITPKRKKRSSKFIPSICSAIDVADHNGSKLVSGFGYRTLKADARRLQV